MWKRRNHWNVQWCRREGIEATLLRSLNKELYAIRSPRWDVSTHGHVLDAPTCANTKYTQKNPREDNFWAGSGQNIRKRLGTTTPVTTGLTLLVSITASPLNNLDDVVSPNHQQGRSSTWDLLGTSSTKPPGDSHFTSFGMSQTCRRQGRDT